jgi:hypothetical protein
MQTTIHELLIFQILVLFCRLVIGRILDPLLGLCGRQRQRYVVLRGGGTSSTQTSWTILLRHRYKPMSTSSCSICKFWFITYSLNMLYFCTSSGYRTPATFLNTSSSNPCVTETYFCGGQRCHSSSTMLSSGICQTGCYASLGGFSLHLQSVCPPFQPCTRETNLMHFSLFSYGISWFVNNVISNFGISGSTGKKDTRRMIGR